MKNPPPYKYRRIYEWADSFEILIGSTVIGRVYRSVERWKCCDFKKKSQPLAQFADFEEGADVVCGEWFDRKRGANSAWA